MTILFSDFLHTSVEVLARVFLSHHLNKKHELIRDSCSDETTRINRAENARSARIFCIFMVFAQYRIFLVQILRPCLHGVGDPGLVGKVSFVLCPPERENKRNQPH